MIMYVHYVICFSLRHHQNAALSLCAPEFAADPLLQDFHLGACAGVDCKNNSLSYL